jgi:predicted metal-dependent hydrolase
VTPPERLEVDGLVVELRRKAVRTVRLHVTDEGLLWCSLPKEASSDEVCRLVRSHRRRIDSLVNQALRVGAEPQLWGEPLTPAAAERLEELYAEELRLRLPPLIELWQGRVGRTARCWTLRWMRSRWGSCSQQTGRITLNLALAALEPRYLEEVLVHELVHLRAPGHGDEFRRHMDALLPTWRALGRDLRSWRPVPRPGTGPDR